MQIEEFWEAYTSSEKELFQRSCRRLLKHTFIVRDKDEENKKAYYFISKRPEPFSAYFRYIGFDIVVDRENGVVMLRKLCRRRGKREGPGEPPAVKEGGERGIVLPLDLIRGPDPFGKLIPGDPGIHYGNTV